MADGNATGHEDQVWVQFQRALGISDAGEGDRIKASAPGAPALVGTVERAFRNELLLRLDQPAPGNAFMGVYRWDDQIVANVHLYLFGEQASQTATRETPVWRSWMERRFPAVTAPAEAGTTTA
jgi:hypothetical protein